MATTRRTNLTPKSARQMLGEMSNARTLLWVFVAFLIHAVLIGATSLGYIRDRWIDPEGAKARAEAGEKAAAEDKEASAATAPAQPRVRPAAAVGDAGLSAEEEKRLLAERKDNPVVKGVTEPAKPDEIPPEPTRNAFELDEDLK